MMQLTGFSVYIQQRLTNPQYDFTYLFSITFLESNGLLQIGKPGKESKRQIMHWNECR